MCSGIRGQKTGRYRQVSVVIVVVKHNHNQNNDKKMGQKWIGPADEQ